MLPWDAVVQIPLQSPLQVFMLSAEDHLDEEMLEAIVNAEHTRVPVYEGERCGLINENGLQS